MQKIAPQSAQRAGGSAAALLPSHCPCWGKSSQVLLSQTLCPWAARSVPLSLLYTLNKPEPLFLTWEEKKERKGKWLLLTNWFHNSFIKPYSKPFIWAPFCSMKSCVLKGRGSLETSATTLSSTLLGGLPLELRGWSCYFSWSDSHLNQIISFVKSNKHWTPQTLFHCRYEWMPLYGTFCCHEIYICMYIYICR